MRVEWGRDRQSLRIINEFNGREHSGLSGGDVIELVGAAADVTEQHWARAAFEMKRSEDQFRMMIDAIPTLAWCCLPDGTTEFLNQRWLDYSGLSLEESLGWGWQVPIHPEDLGKLMDTWLGLLASGEPGDAEARLRRFDGEYRWFLFRAVPVRDERGAVVRWYGTNTDIEDLKRTESLLAGEKRTLEMIARGTSLTAILEDQQRLQDFTPNRRSAPAETRQMPNRSTIPGTGLSWIH